MANLVITATQVMPDATGRITLTTAGAIITAGQTVYVAAGVTFLAQCDGTEAEAAVYGIALNGAQIGQPVAVQETGSPVLGAGAAPVEGAAYSLSDTAGSIADVADIATGTWYQTTMGVGGAGNTLVLEINASGQQIP